MEGVSLLWGDLITPQKPCIRKSNNRLDCNAIHRYFKIFHYFNLTEDDIANKIIFYLRRIFCNTNVGTCKGDYFNFTENVDNMVEVVEVIVESVDENVEDWDIIDFNGEYIASPMNSYLTVDFNLA